MNAIAARGWRPASTSTSAQGDDELRVGRPGATIGGHGDGQGNRQRLRVLCVADSLDVGGAEHHVVGLASALLEAGHEVVLACSIEGSLATTARQSGVQVRPLLQRLVKRRVSPSYARALKKLLAEHDFDLVHAHMYASAAAAALATRHRSEPLVLTEHSQAAWRGRTARLCSRLLYRRAARIIAVSDQIRRRLIDQDCVPDTRIDVIPNALPKLEREPFASVPHERPGPVVGVVARLQPEKGVVYVLRAATQVVKHQPRARFVIVGDGPERARLTNLAAQLGLAAHVIFLGFRPDATSMIPSFDVLAVPSLSEGTPLVVLEGMAAGVPLVASAVGGIPEQVRHGEQGLLVPPQNPDALAQALLAVLGDRALGQRLGAAGRARVATHYAYPAMLRRTLAVYRAVRRPTPTPR